jgi:predicted metal-dependent peptidase
MTRDWNIAADLSINSHISGLPESACVPGKGPFAEFESGLSAEAYLRLIKQKREEEKQKDKGGESQGGGEEGDDNKLPEDNGLDSHQDWGETDTTTSEIAKERVKEHIKEAAKEAQQGNGWGSVSASVKREIIEKLSTKVDWKKVLRYFVKTSRRASKRSTVKRLNKRYAYIHSGKKVTRQARIAISIDQSGSVSDSMLAAFFGELNKLAKLASFTVVPFDTEVFEDKVYDWKKGENKKWERVLSGGTCFDAPTAYVNKHGFDGHIVLTDMMAPKPKASKCQRMWMTTAYYARHPWFKTNERVLAIEGTD